MSIQDKGGPAFPVSDVISAEPNTHAELKAMARGMSLRDYFAAKAMQGICAHHDTWGLVKTEIVLTAYEIADTMLLARNS